MKIVNLVTQMEAAGAQQVAINIASILSGKGYDTEVWFLYLKRPSYTGYKGVRVILNRKPSFIMDYLFIFWGLIKLLRKHRPEVFITHTYYANILGQIAAALFGIRARLAVQHNPVNTYPKFARIIDHILGASGFYKYNIIVSKAVLDSISTYSSLYKKRIKMIYYGIPMLKVTLDKENARRRFGLPLKAPLIVNVGRLAAQKNQHMLLKLLTHIPRVQLAIAGEGELRSTLENEARALGVADRLFLLGEVPPEEIGDFLAAGDVFIFPSIYEATGLAMVEAMQLGLPVIASDIPGIREVLDDEESPAGILVSPEDETGFCLALKNIQMDRNLADSFSCRAKTRAKFYCVRRMAADYEQCFLELLCKAG
jgi:glycosyltransferase involved in cell wall biosynthesis